MRYKLFHNELRTFEPDVTAFRPNPTAIVEAATLSDVFRLTNHIDSAWYNNAGVCPQLRSTSVGDLIVDEAGNRFLVDRVGFTEQPAAAGSEALTRQLQAIVESRQVPLEWRPTLSAVLQLLLSNHLQGDQDADPEPTG